MFNRASYERTLKGARESGVLKEQEIVISTHYEYSISGKRSKYKMKINENKILSTLR